MTSPTTPPQAVPASPSEPTDEQPGPTISRRVQLELDILQSEFGAADERSREAGEPTAAEQ